jgi:hypothetical protein
VLYEVAQNIVLRVWGGVPTGTILVCAVVVEQSFILLSRQSQLFRYYTTLHWMSGWTKHPCDHCTLIYNYNQLGNFKCYHLALIPYRSTSLSNLQLETQTHVHRPEHLRDGLQPVKSEPLIILKTAIPLDATKALGGRGGIAPTHSRPRY